MQEIYSLQIDKFNSNSIERFHLEAEVTKQAYKVKEENIADPNFVNVNLDKILSDEFIDNLYENISLDKCSDIGDLNIPSHPETVYLSVVDKDLNTVSMINSVCYAFGSGITTDKTGIILHNRGTNFRVEEGHPNCIEGLKSLYTFRTTVFHGSFPLDTLSKEDSTSDVKVYENKSLK